MLLTFKKIFESVQSSRRVGIEHLEKLKPVAFVKLIKELKAAGGKFTAENSEISLKVDGFGLRFGLDENNRFFLESSNSGPQFKDNAFTEYTKNKKGEVDKISVAYDEIFKVLKSNKTLQSLLQQYNDGNGIKIICECLYNPIGEEIEEKIRFVSVKYDKKKLGKIATFVLIDVVDGNNRQLDKKILDKIKKLITTDNYKFTDANIRLKKIDFSLEIEDLLKFIEKYPDFETVVVSRKKKDKEIKNIIKSTLVDYQHKMSAKIIQMIDDKKFGDEFEGIVVKFLDKKFKVINKQDFSNKNKYRPE